MFVPVGRGEIQRGEEEATGTSRGGETEGCREGETRRTAAT
jgi:hypothetical protein